MWPFTSRNIGLLAQISYILCQLLLCSGKSQLSNFANAHFKNIHIDLVYVRLLMSWHNNIQYIVAALVCTSLIPRPHPASGAWECTTLWPDSYGFIVLETRVGCNCQAGGCFQNACTTSGYTTYLRLVARTRLPGNNIKQRVHIHCSYCLLSVASAWMKRLSLLST